MAVEILVVGAGAVGAFYASRLAQALETRVSVLCRSNYAAVKAAGFAVSSPQFGDYAFVPSHTFGHVDEARKSEVRWDCIVVSTKALPDVRDDSALLEGLVHETTAIVLIQNGLGVEAPYAERFPGVVICSAVAVISAAQPSPGRIQHNRWTRIHVGPWLPHRDTGGVRDGDAAVVAKSEDFVRRLRAGGITDAEACDHANLQLVRWHKIATNASMNPSSVLTSCTPNSDMVQDAELCHHLKGVMNEVLAAAPKVLGRPFPTHFATAEQLLKSTKKNTSGSKPSMAIDWEQGKRMELEVILGNPLRIARARGIEMPRLQSLYALLRYAQAGREQADANSRL